MKLKKLLPVLVLALLLAYLFLPETTAPALPETPAATSDTVLTLVTEAPSPTETPKPTATPSPTATPKPTPAPTPKPTATPKPTTQTLDENGSYTTKEEAEAAGWTGGSLERVLPGMCIGGSYFGNYEGQLPSAKGRRWTECDVNTLGARSRGAERIVFSNDGLIYYTPDHYESFELLYDGS